MYLKFIFRNCTTRDIVKCIYHISYLFFLYSKNVSLLDNLLNKPYGPNAFNIVAITLFAHHEYNYRLILTMGCWCGMQSIKYINELDSSRKKYK